MRAVVAGERGRWIVAKSYYDQRIARLSGIGKGTGWLLRVLRSISNPEITAEQTWQRSPFVRGHRHGTISANFTEPRGWFEPVPFFDGWDVRVFLVGVEVHGIVEGVWGGREVDVVDAGDSDRMEVKEEWRKNKKRGCVQQLRDRRLQAAKKRSKDEERKRTRRKRQERQERASRRSGQRSKRKKKEVESARYINQKGAREREKKRK